MKTTAILSLLALLLSVPAMAQTPQPSLDNYDVVLLPVFSFNPGAHGSQWETTVSIASIENNATMPVPMLADETSTCAGQSGTINLGVVRHVCPSFNSPSGLFLYVPKSLGSHRLYATSRVRDLTRQASSAGTAIPIVRESQFRSNEILLLDIPSDARFRTNLRIYAGPWTSGGGTQRFINTSKQGVTVDIYASGSLGTSPALASTTLELSEPQLTAGSPYYVRPGYVSIADLVAMFPQLASVPSYTIRIRTGQPLTSPPVDLTTWGFVTITNNQTQEITTIKP
ncbi:MAG TPA: hypothetical protein VGQ76_10870 [Thermoanaerobaculia bacterium]|jgi:hypothetical protein|nr:hypothetical protein [Thermoanaerobaculia bacterium]